MWDFVRFYLLVRRRNSVFLIYSPRIEQSLLWVWQGLLLLHRSHNILHMTRNASGAPRSACSEKTGTNGHMSCWSQTQTTSSDPYRVGISRQHRLCNFFSRFIWNLYINYLNICFVCNWARFVTLTLKLLGLECSILCSVKVYLVDKC